MEDRIDARIYGFDGFSTAPIYGGAGVGAVPTSSQVDQVSVLAGSNDAQIGAGTLAANNRERATPLESFGAGVSTWTTSDLVRRWNRQDFTPEPSFDSKAANKAVPFALTSEQYMELRNTQSPEEHQYWVDNMERVNTARTASGDHPIVSAIAIIADPVWFGIDAVTLGAGRVARLAGASRAAGSVVQGVVGAGTVLALGKTTQREGMSEEVEVWAGAMIMGSIGAATYKPAVAGVAGGMVPNDAMFPATALRRTAQELEAAHTAQLIAEDAADFVGPVRVYKAPLTESRVPATGEGAPPSRYAGAGDSPLEGQPTRNYEYDPKLPLDDATQRALHVDSNVTFVQSTAEIADHSPNVRSGHIRIDKDAVGVYIDAEDRVFIVRDNIKPETDMKGLVLHEVGVHMNGERALGTTVFGQLLDRVEELALAGNNRAKQAFRDVPKTTEGHLVREEALAAYIERNHANMSDAIIARMVTGFKAKLNSMGLASFKFSEGDIVRLIRKSAKKKAGSFDQAFPYVWHGGPVKGIDELDTQFIGTGEGRQSYGWGHYVTAEKGTALAYRAKESARRGMQAEEGGLYRLKINAKAEDFLDLEAPLSSQTVKVKAALAGLGLRPGMSGLDAINELAKGALGSPKAVAEYLASKGLAGNKYSTGRTRWGGTKSSNYVLYDNSRLDMQARYSKGLGVTTQQQAAKTVAQKFAGALEISLHKTMSNYSKRGSEIADLLFADPLDRSGNAVASIRRAVRADLSRPQYVYEELLSKEMAARGAGTFKQATTSGAALKVQQSIEKPVYMELLRRDRLSRDGRVIDHTGIDPNVTAMADASEAATDLGLAERKRAGVFGADAVQESRGHMTRRWDNAKAEAIYAKIEAFGPVRYGARQVMVDWISVGMQRANGWDAELAGDIAKAILDRTRAIGYFEDTVLRKHVGQDSLAEVRNLMEGSGISAARMQRVLDTLAGKADDAGKNATLKHRVDISMDEAITLPGGERVTIADMLDTGVASHLERYLDGAAADVAFARRGLTTRSSISDMRSELSHSIADVTKREEALDDFDNGIAAIRGEPTGEKMHEYMRAAAAVNQMVSLGASMLWQATEYAVIMLHYGAGRVMAEAVKELPIIRNILGSKHESTHLREILMGNASQDVRLRPFIRRMEDGFEIAPSAQVQLALQQAKQLVPYINGMKLILNHQSRVVGNLVVSTFERAAKGDIKAAKALEAYGLESHVLAAIQQDIASFGMDTAKWSNKTWDAVRTPLTKMMDDSVLRANTGEIPAWAQFSQVGKFFFTFRGFTLAAHNKVLASTLHNQGFAGLGLAMLYQFPLMMMATAANNTISGKKEMTEEELLKASFSRLGVLGLLTEITGAVLGGGAANGFGSVGTIGIDKGFKLVRALSSAAQGDEGSLGNLGAATLGSIPLLATFLPMKAIGESLKGN